MTVLLTPGPVQVSDSVLDAERYLSGHRSAEFRSIVGDCRDSLLRLSGADYVAVTTGSGTLAVESMLYSYLHRDEEVLCVSYGEFGNRIGTSLERRGARVHRLAMSVDEPLSFEHIEEKIKRHPVSAVTIVHNETGNGTSIRNLQEVTKKCKDAGLKVIVDSVSGFGCIPISLGNSGIDMLATCGHKGIASTPGIGIVAVSSEAYRGLHDSDVPAYLDIKKSLQFMEKDETPYTPSVSSFNALRRALKILEREGLNSRVERTSHLAFHVRKELQDNGFRVVGTEQTYSDSVINFHIQKQSAKAVQELFSLGYAVSRGLGELSGTTLRIGVMGEIDRAVVDNFLESLYSVDASP